MKRPPDDRGPRLQLALQLLGRLLRQGQQLLEPLLALKGLLEALLETELRTAFGVFAQGLDGLGQAVEALERGLEIVVPLGVARGNGQLLKLLAPALEVLFDDVESAAKVVIGNDPFPVVENQLLKNPEGCLAHRLGMPNCWKL